MSREKNTDKLFIMDKRTRDRIYSVYRLRDQQGGMEVEIENRETGAKVTRYFPAGTKASVCIEQSMIRTEQIK